MKFIYTFTYLFGCIGLFFVWLAVFFSRKDLRKDIIISGLLLLPFSVTDFFFVPNYWDPPSLFDLIRRIGFGIESILFVFIAGGACAVLFEFVLGKKIQDYVINVKKLWPYALLAILWVGLNIISPMTVIWNSVFALLLPAIIILVLKPEFLKPMLISAGIFTLVYFLIFSFLANFVMPGVVEAIWNLKNMTRIMILGVPIEEIFFAFAWASYCATAYRFARRYDSED